MDADDLILVSVDDHLVEPPHMFDGRLPARFEEQAPKVVRNDAGADVWTFGGSVIPNIGLNAVAGRPKEEYGIEPTAFDEMRPGCYDIGERVKDMSAGGVLASMCFPSFPGFSARLFAAADDKELALAVVQAYNDWHIEEWCGSYPGRFIPMALPVLWDPELAAAEVRRVAAKGCHSVTFTENPASLGFPSFHDAAWDPFWTALCWYSFDPFAHRSKEQCTVGALRAEVADHDVSIRSYDRGRFERTQPGINLGELTKSATA